MKQSKDRLHRVLVIGATNRADIMDPAVLRPGRFDAVLFVPPPDRDSRLEILKVHTHDMPLGKDVKLETLADLTEGYSGADIEGLTREAAMVAVRSDWKAKPVTMEHFQEAMKDIRPSISEEDAKRFMEIAENVLRRQPKRKEAPLPQYM